MTIAVATSLFAASLVLAILRLTGCNALPWSVVAMPAAGATLLVAYALGAFLALVSICAMLLTQLSG